MLLFLSDSQPITSILSRAYLVSLPSFRHQQEQSLPSMDIQLPPGFKFHPSDEELIVHYLRNKATSVSLPASVIAEVDLYKCNPWELPNKALFGEEEWYFFTPRDRKYPNGNRPNRTAASGYWKATGTDKPILSSRGASVLGVKKGLVFYKGRPPRGEKTGWVMHEYRLPETTKLPSRQKGSMRLDEWVLCRVRQKSNNPKNRKEDPSVPASEPCTTEGNRLCTASTTNKLDIVRDYLYRDCLVLPLILATQDLPSLDTVSSLSFEHRKCSSSSAGEEYSKANILQKPSMPIDSLINGEKKRMPSEGEWHESVIQPKKKQFQRDDQWSNRKAELNFCGTGQCEGNISNTSEWSYLSQYQELNCSTLAEDDFSLLR